MLKIVEELQKEVLDFCPKSEEDVELFRLKFLGKKGKLTALFDSFKNVPNANKKAYGQAINNLKQSAKEKVRVYKGSFTISGSVKKN